MDKCFGQEIFTDLYKEGEFVNLEKFAKKYKREPRQNSKLSSEHIDESMRPFLQPDTPEIISAITLDSPVPSYELLYEVDLQDTLRYFNSILIYRILKKMYTNPDIVAAFISRKATGKSIKDEITGCGATDWSYSMRIDGSLIAEIRSMFHNTRSKLRFWSCYMPDDEKTKKEYGRLMAGFLNDFNKTIENNRYLFEEAELLKNKHLEYSAAKNIFAEKYKAAETLLSFADTFEIKGQKVQLKFEENPKVSSAGAIYLSSTIFFIIALESLVNALYSLLIKKEFDAENYERITIKSDLDIRLCTMHLFCNGFKSQIISPQTGLWNNMRKLREFRNIVIHGNLTDDDRVYSVIEDKIMFFYGPTLDYRGKSAEKKAGNRFPVTMPQITGKIVLSIKEIVDEIVKSILTAMNDETRNWVEGWIKELMIPPRSLQ